MSVRVESCSMLILLPGPLALKGGVGRALQARAAPRQSLEAARVSDATLARAVLGRYRIGAPQGAQVQRLWDNAAFLSSVCSRPVR